MRVINFTEFLSMSTVHLIISGKVQGVFFRATAKEIADKLGVNGWVKNTPEGNVEAMATGTQEQIESFVAWCKKGPPKAKVENVEVSKADETPFSGFEVKRKYV